MQQDGKWPCTTEKQKKLGGGLSPSLLFTTSSNKYIFRTNTLFLISVVSSLSLNYSLWVESALYQLPLPECQQVILCALYTDAPLPLCLSIDISSYLIPKPTMCDIGFAVCPMATVHPLHSLCFTNSQETVVILPLHGFCYRRTAFLWVTAPQRWREINQITPCGPAVIMLCFSRWRWRACFF